MRWFERPSGFEFQDHNIFYNKISAKVPDPLPTKPYRNLYLLRHIQPCLTERQHHRRLIDRLKKSLPQLVVHFEEHPDNLLSQASML